MYDFMTLFAENVTEVDFDAERDAIVKFYSTFTPPPANKLQVIARGSRVQLLAFFGVVLRSSAGANTAAAGRGCRKSYSRRHGSSSQLVHVLQLQVRRSTCASP
jgi:hypothetical protein